MSTTVDGEDIWRDIPRFLALPQTVGGQFGSGGLALSPDETRLVVVVTTTDAVRSRWVPSLWEIPISGGTPRRLTDAEQGATDPVFHPDGTLLFVAAGATTDEPGLWVLEDDLATPLADRPGGLTAPLIARDSGDLVAVGRRLAGSTADDDAARRAVRRERRITAVVHSWMPVRDPFREHDVEYPQLLMAQRSGPVHWRDLAADAGKAMVKVNPLTCVERSISADGHRVAAMWSTPRPHGAFPYGVMVIDTRSGERFPLSDADQPLLTSPRISPDGRRVAAMAIADGTFDTPVAWALRIFDTSDATGVCATIDASLGDLYPVQWAWSADGDILYVSGDLHGRGAVLAIDGDTGAVMRRLACDAVYALLVPSRDGRTVYALRSSIDTAPRPVALDVGRRDQVVRRLPDPAPAPPLPGRVEEVHTAVDGATVSGRLCLPADASADAPAPLMQWIHGGPLISFNTWSWQVSPWVMVAHGWAVLMPDPALSTGYGPDWIARGWPHRAAPVWHDIEALLDEVGLRGDVDVTRAACMGASFGGFMTNWLAGHTDRFGAIVTHAGLYALDQQHDTSEQAYRKNRWFGTRAQHPEWYAENSPHDVAASIRTPMLIIHGNLDYNIPITEALRLWWDLCDQWDRDPAEMPHRLLQFIDEGHFVSRPAHLEIWTQAILAFCATHVLGRPTEFSPLI